MALRRPAARARAAWRRPPPRRWVPGLPGWVPAVCRTSLTAGVASLQAEPPVLAEDVRRWLQAEGADPGDPAEEQLGLAWRLLRRAEARLGDVERRRAEELREVRAGATG